MPYNWFIGKRLGPLLLSVTLLVACAPAPVSGSPSPSPAAPITFRTGTSAGAVVVANGAAWVTNPIEGSISRIDVASNRVAATIRIGDPATLLSRGCGAANVHSVPHGSFLERACDVPSAIAAFGGAIWATANDQDAVVRIDPATNRVAATFPIGINPFEIGAGPSGLWVTDFAGDRVLHVDPASGAIIASIAVDHGPSGIAVSSDAVWTANTRADQATRIDPANNRVVAVIPVGHRPLPVAIAFGSVWIRNEGTETAGTVTRIDPGTNQVISAIAVGADAGRDGLDAIAVTPRGLWIAGLKTQRIDPVSDRVAQTILRSTNAVTYGAGSLWTTDTIGTIGRLEPAGGA